jgi:hypothetical protein
MSVTGILIVVSLMLALQIDRVADSNPKKGITSDSDLPTVSNIKLDALEESVAILKRKLETLQGAARKTESKTEIFAQINRLERRVTELSLRNSSTDKNQPISSKYAELLRLREEIRLCEEEVFRFSKSADETGTRMRELEQKVKELEALAISARIKSRNLVLIREPSDTTKEPIIVDVGKSSMRVMRFDHAEILEDLSLDDFRKTISKFRKQDQYFVLYFRPEGACRFQEIKDEVKNAGFELGYDAIAEGVEITLGKGGGQ